MTGPNPDAELDAALGVAELPPAEVTVEHLELARSVLYPPNDPPSARRSLHGQPGPLDERVAQLIADAEQRGAARVLAERAAAGAL